MAKRNADEKILDVDASMQGTISFKDPVNLRINGSFEGKLDTRGNLTIGENANVKADIQGDRLIIAGKVTGDIIAFESLTAIAPAYIQGNIRTPKLSVAEGSIIEGQLIMTNITGPTAETLSLREVAQYLELEAKVVQEWAEKKKIPARMEKGEWRFSRTVIDKWVQDEKVKS
ncbi:MAG: hypothetical protein COV74_06740 [Candidatus Omnitrophica bacterium CG11_big_fil_rev_8_21_14_0_20_45_26]|uniref:Helix-turn-helix domain-containing protein n=1 Tax=Candidatus Abzuiibacterium crystallinum TaxID=1974748 RepID=A0A2H0LN45_9BACT|nr:MAG: hypothetical protein COV74_06740 [Candidatus Omnitrophica bacterium CG11_big_fil_rev_8_21_14_0_20_45_26]PIW65072.1 MAG: hypothetical protein COW12_03440 [Candidatus Omnitrophica bacterium CG12_big_fil_rev_8_21_14_0_65_45_16]